MNVADGLITQVRKTLFLTGAIALYSVGPAFAQDSCGFNFALDETGTAEPVVDYEGFSDKDDAKGSILTENIAMSAQSASFDTENQKIIVEGDVELLNNQARLTAASAEYSALEGAFSLKNSTFAFKETRSRGEAEELYLSQQGIARLTGAKYTTCPENKEDWSLNAKEITLDINKGVATTRGAALRFKKVPILYLPYASYPISDQRKSGLLIPELKTSGRRGLEIATPWYWNIAPNYDATLTPRYMEKRGFMMGAETRLKTERSMNAIGGDYIKDKLTDTDRYNWYTDSSFYWTPDWRMTLDAAGVSDVRYLNDYSSRQSISSQTNINRSLTLEHFGEVWSVMARFQDFQTIDELIVGDDKPYTRLPQVAATGNWQNGFIGADYKLITEATYFARDRESVQGGRLHIEPEISYPLSYNGIYLTPKASLFHTSYLLDNQFPGEDDTPSVTTGIFSVDSGATFERTAAGGNLAITLEPRAQYVYIPYENQDNLPVFDTIRPDSTLVQLFRPNRYLAYDRVGDTNQLNLGITSRFISTSTGRQLLTATLAQARYFEDQKVTLPGETPRSSNSGDYLLRTRVDLYDSWNLDLGYQWNSSASETSQTDARLQLKVWKESILNLGYRYTKDSFDQGDISFILPVNSQWNILARSNYSFEDRSLLDQFAGIEYENCCWGIRLIGRRQVTRDLDQPDNSVGVQFILKGFTEVGNSVRGTFERGILGYGDL